MRSIVLAAIVFVVVAGAAVYWLFVRDSGEDVAAFFTLPTPTICESGALSITAASGHFAAFTEGRSLDQSGDKFLVASISITNEASTAAAVSEEHFYLTERPGQTRRPAALKDGGRPLSNTLAPGETASGVVAFSVPASVGAAKLVYDDGCTHQEWLLP